MNIVWTRRVTQGFFLGLFVLACLATVPGGAGRWSETPPNLFLYLDPLALLAAWAGGAVLPLSFLGALSGLALTVCVGRFFCGWICPLGTLQQAIAWWAHRRAASAARIRANAYRRSQTAKYYVLAALTAGSLVAAGARLLGLPEASAWHWAFGSHAVGWLDPLCLLHRAVHMSVFPWWGPPRHFVQSWAFGGLLLAILLLCIRYPRVYCRFVCPLGALCGLVARWSLLRPGKVREPCSNCRLCEQHCEGACTPATRLRSAECVLCLNCLHACPDNVVGYRMRFSPSVHHDAVDATRRAVVISMGAGAAALAWQRLNGALGRNFSPRLLRPPGARPEPEFLARCLKCGQCMGTCPTNIIQPAAWETGWEGLWTPVLNYRIGRGGCLPECTACGEICPTGAIRRLTVDERLGRGSF